MNNHKCGACGEAAEYFKRDGAKMQYACNSHAPPGWKRIDAMGGGIHAAEKSAAEVLKATAGEKK
jgi:hypothetical protein